MSLSPWEAKFNDTCLAFMISCLHHRGCILLQDFLLKPFNAHSVPRNFGPSCQYCQTSGPSKEMFAVGILITCGHDELSKWQSFIVTRASCCWFPFSGAVCNTCSHESALLKPSSHSMTPHFGLPGTLYLVSPDTPDTFRRNCTAKSKALYWWVS